MKQRIGSPGPSALLEVQTPAQEAAAQPHLSPIVQALNVAAVTVPFAGLVVAMILLWGRGFELLHLYIFLGMYLLTGIGVTVGYHRLFTHRAFAAPKPVRAGLAVLGAMAVEGPLLKWVANHRQHHQHADEHDDPHSPHLHGDGFRGMVKGMWHAHMGWIFLPDSRGLAKYVTDLKNDHAMSVISSLFPLWVVLGLLIPAAIGGLVTMSWYGALLGFIWGGLVRICFVHHLTWSINSVCHMWGSQPYDNGDHSKNNIIFGVLALGEGWHNNHHAFPTSARHGLSWWQIDVSYWIIRGMELVGMASKVRVPNATRLAEKRAAKANYSIN